jgi:hypothetical protein
VPRTVTNTQISELAQRTFQALEPYINVRCAGVEWEGHPRFRVTKQARALHARHKKGERGLTYENGGPFSPRQVYAGYQRPRDVGEAIAGRKHYYTGGRRGRTLVYVDVDAHRPWQDDPDETRKVISEFLGPRNVLCRRSNRGHNLYLKVEYGGLGYGGVNATLKDFGRHLQAYCAARGCKCTVEVKGLISESDAHLGTLAKLPCYGGAEPWTGASLEAFVQAPCRPIQWLGRKGVEMAQAAQEIVGHSARPTRCPARTSAPGKPGSTSGLPFEVEDVQALLESKAVRHRAAYLYAMHVPPARGRLTREDFAQAWSELLSNLVDDGCFRRPFVPPHRQTVPRRRPSTAAASR